MSNIREIAENFLVDHSIQEISAISSGHIQQTYLVEGMCDGVTHKAILQSINTNIFPDPDLLVSNHLILLDHLVNQESESIIPNLIQTADKNYLIAYQGQIWRAQVYQENSITHLRASTPTIAIEGARMIGKFMHAFSDLDASLVRPAIPQFHHLPKYLQMFDEVLVNGNLSRGQEMSLETSILNEYRSSILQRFYKIQELPERICHADTKISNILFDRDTGKGLKVIDLDTVMPGKVPFDFADMVRSFVPSLDENAQNFTDLSINEDIFEALCEGFIGETRHVLNTDEINALFDGTLVLVYEQTIRFLWDYLNNDQYYGISYAEQNKMRTRNQLKLFNELISFEKRANDLIRNIL